MNVWQDTATWNDRVTKHLAQLFVVSHGKHQMSRVDRLSLVVTASVSCKLDDFGCEVLEHCCHENTGSWGTTFGVVSTSKVSGETSDWEGESSSGGLGGVLALAFSSFLSFCHG